MLLQRHRARPAGSAACICPAATHPEPVHHMLRTGRADTPDPIDDQRIPLGLHASLLASIDTLSTCVVLSSAQTPQQSPNSTSTHQPPSPPPAPALGLPLNSSDSFFFLFSSLHFFSLFFSSLLLLLLPFFLLSSSLSSLPSPPLSLALFHDLTTPTLGGRGHETNNATRPVGTGQEPRSRLRSSLRRRIRKDRRLPAA